jgi:hypothetical protein
MAYTLTITNVSNNFTVAQPDNTVAISQTSTAVTINPNAIIIQTKNTADTFRGEWAANTVYFRGDTATYGGVLYLARNNVTSATVPSTDTTNWTRYVVSTTTSTFATLTATNKIVAASSASIEFLHPTASTAKISVPTTGDLSGVLVFTATSIRLVTPGTYGVTYIDGSAEAKNGIYIDGHYNGQGAPLTSDGTQVYDRGDLYLETGSMALQFGNVNVQQGRINVQNNLFLSKDPNVAAGTITGTNVTIVAGNQITLNENTNGQTKVYGVLRVNNGFTVNAAGETTTAKITFPDNTTMTTAPTGGATTVNYTGITGTGQQQLDSLDTTAYDTAKYFIRVKDGSNYHITEIVIFYDGTDVGFSQYGIITNNSTLGTFTADKNGSNVRLLFTPSGATSMSIRVAKTPMAL